MGRNYSLSSAVVTLFWFWFSFSTLLLVAPIVQCNIHQWSHQQTIRVPQANTTYGITTPLLVGRGFMTLVTGYDADPPGIYVHTTDNGYVTHGHEVWSQQARLVAAGMSPGDQFGRTMVSFNQTLVVAAPNAIGARGAVFIFNGTLRHWSQVQRLTALDATPGDTFGDTMSLHNNRLLIGARGQSSNGGVAYIYERPVGSIYWSRMAKLVPRDQRAGQNFAQSVSLYKGIAAITALNDDNPGVQTGCAYLFTGQSVSE